MNDVLFVSLFHRYKNLGSRIFKKGVENVTDAERSQAKTLTLGLLYGMGTNTMAGRLGISYQEAKRITQTFFSEFRFHNFLLFVSVLILFDNISFYTHVSVTKSRERLDAECQAGSEDYRLREDTDRSSKKHTEYF